MFKKDDHSISIIVGEEIPDEQQQLLWDILESFLNSNKQNQVDRLQIFKLSVIKVNENAIQRVTHIQEYPSIIEKNIFAVAKPVDTTVLIYLEDGQNNFI